MAFVAIPSALGAPVPTSTRPSLSLSRPPPAWHPFRPFRCARPIQRPRCCTPAPPAQSVSLPDFLSAAHSLGTIRFVAITPGAVLETIGRFDYPHSLSSTPSGPLLTLYSPDRTFECHIRLARTATITLSTQPAKFGSHTLYVIRFLDKDDAIILSCLLQYDPSQGPGHYLHGAVDAFNSLVERFGPTVNLQPQPH